MWTETRDKVRETDRLSFFVKGKRFPELTGDDILAHDAGHVNNALSKLSRYTDAFLHGKRPDVATVQKQVVPDLWIYGFQVATAYGISQLASYAAASGIKAMTLEAVSSEKELIDLQTAEDRENLPESIWKGRGRDPIATIAYERFTLSESAISMTRVADQADHGVYVPGEPIAHIASGRLLVAAVRIADAMQVDLAAETESRLVEIREKYGTAE